MYALDTNAVIHALKEHGRVRQRLAAKRPSDLCVRAVTLYELRFGTLKAKRSPQRQSDLDLLLSLLTVLPFDSNAADRAARIRPDLEEKGSGIGPRDTLIAGSVLAHGAILFTHNVDEFSTVPGLEIEDWF